MSTQRGSVTSGHTSLGQSVFAVPSERRQTPCKPAASIVCCAVSNTRRRSLRHLHPFSPNNAGIIGAITGRMCTVTISYLPSCIVCCRRLYPHQSRAMSCTSASPFYIAVLISAMSFHSVRYAIVGLRHANAAYLIYIPQVVSAAEICFSSVSTEHDAGGGSIVTRCTDADLIHRSAIGLRSVDSGLPK